LSGPPPIKALEHDMTEFEHILVVDDDERICRLLRRYLEQEGFSVDTVVDGASMWAKLNQREPDLIVLDLMLPGVDGLTLARELRAKTNVGIIILTGKHDPVDTIVGLEVGADDYVTKPFDKRELLARIRSVLRRYSGSSQPDRRDEKVHSSEVLRFNGWQMKLDSYELISPDGETINLSNHEFRLLTVLVQNSRMILSRDQILQRISRRNWMPDDRSVDVTIGKLRKVIEEDSNKPKLIRTVRGVGYQFTGKVEKA